MVFIVVSTQLSDEKELITWVWMNGVYSIRSRVRIISWRQVVRVYKDHGRFVASICRSLYEFEIFFFHNRVL